MKNVVEELPDLGTFGVWVRDEDKDGCHTVYVNKFNGAVIGVHDSLKDDSQACDRAVYCLGGKIGFQKVVGGVATHHSLTPGQFRTLLDGLFREAEKLFA